MGSVVVGCVNLPPPPFSCDEGCLEAVPSPLIKIILQLLLSTASIYQDKDSQQEVLVLLGTLLERCVAVPQSLLGLCSVFAQSLPSLCTVLRI